MNVVVTLVIIAAMIAGWLDPVVAFMLGVVLALVINYPNVKLQKDRVNAHAEAALLMAGILFAAGAFTGIMTHSNMLHAMATEAVAHLPKGLETQIPFTLGVTSMPLSLLTLTHSISAFCLCSRMSMATREAIQFTSGRHWCR